MSNCLKLTTGSVQLIPQLTSITPVPTDNPPAHFNHIIPQLTLITPVLTVNPTAQFKSHNPQAHCNHSCPDSYRPNSII